MIDVQTERKRLFDDVEELIAIKREYQQLRAERSQDVTRLTKYREFRARLEALHARICSQAERLERLHQ